MRTFRVVATDLDGTILDADDLVSARVAAAFDGVVRAGALVVVATARPPRWIPSAVRELAPGGLVICTNGALVFEAGSWRTVRETLLPAGSTGPLVDAIRGLWPDSAFAFEYPDGFAREPGFFGSRAPEGGAVSGDAAALALKPVAKVLVRDRAFEPDVPWGRLREVTAGRAEVTASGLSGVIELGPAGVSKASALALLCRDRGVAPDEVLAFGDMPNDAQMLSWAGWGVAVGNAHPDLVKVADEVTGSVEEDGVAEVLERYFPASGDLAAPARG